MRASLILIAALLPFAASPAVAEPLEVTPQSLTVWKPVFGQVEARVELPARARIGGTVAELLVTEGDQVEAGQTIAEIRDDKLKFQIASLDAQLSSARAQLDTAQTNLDRGISLKDRGVITAQSLDDLQTSVDVLNSTISNLQAQRLVIEQQVSEGAVLAPEAGVVLDVPLSRGSVVVAGDTLVTVGAGGTFLRLSIPERFAATLAEGDAIAITTAGGEKTGTLAKLYPLVESGRLQADVELEGLDPRYIGLRVPVRLPVGTREVLLVPETALYREGGLDLVRVETAAGALGRVVVPGESVERNGTVWREILTGLEAGETVLTDD